MFLLHFAVFGIQIMLTTGPIGSNQISLNLLKAFMVDFVAFNLYILRPKSAKWINSGREMMMFLLLIVGQTS